MAMLPLQLEIDIEIEDQRPEVQLIYQNISTQEMQHWLETSLNNLNAFENLPDFCKKILSLFSDFYVSLIFIDSQKMQGLNYQYRQKNASTNILSFPSAIPIDFYQNLPESEQQYTLGDLVVDLSVIQKEASSQNKPLVHHLAHILVHGLLHLCSFDHELENDACIMENIEIALLAKLGIPNPYLDFIA